MVRTVGALLRSAASRDIRRRFRNEILLLGGKHEAMSPRPSIIHFTVERAASRFVGHLMQTLAAGAGMTPIDFDSYFFELGKIDKWTGEDRGGRNSGLFKERGYCYSPLRTVTDHLLHRRGFRILLSLRDPRDVLVSLHHNYAYEDPLPRLAGRVSRFRLLRKRTAAQRQTVDDFAFAFFRKESHIRRSYEAYCEHLVGRPDVLFVRYEDMVSDFDTWLDRVVDFFEFGSATAAIKRFRETADFQPAPNGPKRQVTPGEHRRVLRPDTIRELNTKGGHILASLGYAAEPDGL